jgi:hypothetical protein
MFEQVSNQVLGFGKNFAQSIVRANSIAMEGFEKLVDTQLKAFEGSLHAAGEFAQEFSELRDAEGLRTVWPKGLTLVKDQAEKAVATFQEVISINTRTNEALVGLVKGNLEAAGESVSKTAKAASKRAAA